MLPARHGFLTFTSVGIGVLVIVLRGDVGSKTTCASQERSQKRNQERSQGQEGVRVRSPFRKESFILTISSYISLSHLALNPCNRSCDCNRILTLTLAQTLTLTLILNSTLTLRITTTLPMTLTRSLYSTGCQPYRHLDVV